MFLTVPVQHLRWIMYPFHVKMLILVTKRKLIECLLSRKVSYIVCNIGVSISIRVTYFFYFKISVAAIYWPWEDIFWEPQRNFNTGNNDSSNNTNNNNNLLSRYLLHLLERLVDTCYNTQNFSRFVSHCSIRIFEQRLQTCSHT